MPYGPQGDTRDEGDAYVEAIEHEKDMLEARGSEVQAAQCLTDRKLEEMYSDTS
jgi:hypothetical protein